MLKRIIKLKVLLSLLSLTAATSWAAPKYPAVEDVQGAVSLTGKDGGKIKLTTKTPLLEKALFETSDDSTVRVALDGVRHFVVQPNSAVLLPTISWEGGEAPVLILRSGSIRWVQKENEKPSYNTVLRSDLYEFLPPAGDFIFLINSPKAYGEVKVLKGAIEFSALNGETPAQAKAGEQVGFQGMVEGGEIAYDVLLKGKKIPRGNLTPVTKISDKELASFDSAEKKRQAQAAQLAKKQQKAAQAAKKSGAICSAPSARFNECAWVKKGSSCQRRRCNANGDWAEETLLNAQNASINCKAQPVVAPCDY
ncbi:hypothetical protein [Bdellovibrio sp. KM01]|uniref:hypothetical protein n=1 Tax=Bdellovibrio sp. KM01 TaxID=2748865 RepID=UPI0021045765|nr:hypothetical protein [Bdellovibrio sp. KM01]